MPPPKQVDVQVVDGLATIGAGVDNQAVAFGKILGTGDLSGGGDQMAEHGGILGRGMGQRGEVLFGDDQNVHRCLRIDVRKREDVAILIEALDGDGARGDFAEQTIHKTRYEM